MNRLSRNLLSARLQRVNEKRFVKKILVVLLVSCQNSAVVNITNSKLTIQ